MEAREDSISLLAALIVTERPRIVRLWAKRLSGELHVDGFSSSAQRHILDANLAELGRLLTERGEDAAELWSEVMRPLGPRRFDEHFQADDVVRELKVLHHVLLQLYMQRYRRLDPEVAVFLAQLIGEATAAVQASFARVLKTEEVRFREAALMESILHHVDVGILVAEADGTLSYATPAVSRLLGVPVRAVLGTRTPKTLAAILAQAKAHHTDGSPFRLEDMPFVRALEQKGPVRGVMMHITRQPRGEEAWLEMAASPMWDDVTNELVGVIQTVTDRTETAQSERALGKAQEELRRLQARLAERMRTQALGQLAANTAHALNNFFNIIRLRITLLRKEFNAEHLEALDRTVRNVGGLVARLQDFSSEAEEEEHVTVPWLSVLDEALAHVRPELAQAGKPISIKLAVKTPVDVSVDPLILRELLVNLLLTARDRTPDGGGLTLTLLQEEGHGVFELRDEGPAVSEEELGRMFDPLDTRTGSPQTSLMLAVARHQLRRWGGDLECLPAIPAGLRWRVSLPAATRSETATPSPPVATGPKLSTGVRSVLVVDDDPENARMLAEVLTDEGYDVRVAHTGEATLDAWTHHRFDAALLDARMPDVSGWELAKKIRSETPDARIAMITGADIRGQSRNNLALVDALFRKPIDVQALDEFLSHE